MFACAVAVSLWTFFNPRRLRFRRLMREFDAASKRHSYYMAEGDLERARVELVKMDEILRQEKLIL
jgi:hypothetical protein